MHEQIAQFPSQVMYNSKLKAHPSVASHLLRDLPNVSGNTNGYSKEDVEDVEKEVLGTPVVFFDTAGCEYFERIEGDGDEGSKCNENEATVVRKWVEQLVSLEISVLALRYIHMNDVYALLIRLGRGRDLTLSNRDNYTVRILIRSSQSYHRTSL